MAEFTSGHVPPALTYDSKWWCSKIAGRSPVFIVDPAVLLHHYLDSSFTSVVTAQTTYLVLMYKVHCILEYECRYTRQRQSSGTWGSKPWCRLNEDSGARGLQQSLQQYSCSLLVQIECTQVSRRRVCVQQLGRQRSRQGPLQICHNREHRWIAMYHLTGIQVIFFKACHASSRASRRKLRESTTVAKTSDSAWLLW